MTSRFPSVPRALAVACLLTGGLLSGAASAAPSVCLLRADHSRAFFAAQGADKDRLLAPWRAALSRLGHAACEIPAHELAGPAKPAVLVIASAVALSAQERASITAFAGRGGSVLATWASGARDETGQWLGYGWLRQVFGVEVAGEIAPDSDERHLLPFGESPLNTRVGAGRRLFLNRSTEPLLRARLHETGERQPPPGVDASAGATAAAAAANAAATSNTVPLAAAAARYGVWHRHAHNGVAGLAAFTYLEHAGSRRVWLGVPETAWMGAQADIESILGDALAWALRTPRVALAAWPAPHRAAFLVEMDTEEQFQNARVFAAALDRHGLPGTFYCLTSEAAKFPELTRELALRHEIAYHAERHIGFKDLPGSEQAARLAAMIGQLAPLVPARPQPAGFRAPLESYDRTTEIALRNAGIRHHAADPAASDDMLPFFSRAEPELDSSQALVVLPRTLLDDINFVRMGVAGDGVRAELLLGLADVERFRGFGLLSVHTQNYAPGGELDRAMDTLLATLAARRSQLWIAPGGAIEAWWRQRARLRMRLLSTAPDALELELSAQAPGAPVEGAQIVVIAPAPDHVPVLNEGLLAQRRRQEIVTAARLDAQRWRIDLPAITDKPRTYSIRFVARP
ncbi:MAG: polysaccharide deacetylase family protein [Burkholderiaceae bacterium]|nr:polysaccharide deacetylase family protein [Burkholderiaceae bacterium]